MVNVEKASTVAMEIITYAGMARSSYLMALSAFKEKRYSDVEALIAQGDENFTMAHHSHADTLNEEMSSCDPQITLLLTHAEDQLMAAETIKILVLENIAIYQELRGGKNE